MKQAIRMALRYAEEHLELRDVFGQDVGEPLGGVFTATQNLSTSWNSPLDERGIISMATGIALTGERCVAEIQFCDYIFNAIDLLKIAGNTHWVSHGNYHLPLVVMTPVGAGIRGSIYHSHSFDSWASRLVGWKVVMPSTPIDAYGLMLASIRDPNPVLFLKPKALMRVRGEALIPGEPEDQKELARRIDTPVDESRAGWEADWPKLDDLVIEIGTGRVARAGERVTLVTWGRYVSICEQVAAEMGQSVEIIDLRSIYPYDWAMILKSVRKTKRALFVNEDTEVTNFAEHLAHRLTTELFYELEAPPRVLAGTNLPGIGLHPNLEDASVPQPAQIRQALEQMLGERP